MAGLNLFTNNASTTLASGISAVATSLTVASATGALFPNPTAGQYFYATLSNTAGTIIEIVKVTARSTDTFTIVRAQDNTTASAYITGDKVELRLVNANLTNFPQLDSTNTFAQTQTFVTPVLGTPTSATLTNATGLPLTTGVTGTLPVANGGTGVTTSTGTGAGVHATSPTLVTPILGTPTSGTLTNATGLPLTTGVTGTLPTANGGTGLTTVGTADQLLGSNGTTLAYTKVGIANLSATGTASASTYLRGDNTWQTISLSGYATTAQALGSLTGTDTGDYVAQFANYGGYRYIYGRTLRTYNVAGTLINTVTTNAFGNCNCNC